MATTFASSSAQIATLFSSLQLRPFLSLQTHRSLPPASPLTIISSKNPIFSNHPFHLISQRRNKICAASQDVVTSEATAIETSQQIVSTGDDGVSTVISLLLFVAFLGLSILTIGVIYLGVTDFLQKREKEKFEKEEAAKQSGKKKKKKVRARAGPRGFGQKVDEDEVDD